MLSFGLYSTLSFHLINFISLFTSISVFVQNKTKTETDRHKNSPFSVMVFVSVRVHVSSLNSTFCSPSVKRSVKCLFLKGLIFQNSAQFHNSHVKKKKNGLIVFEFFLFFYRGCGVPGIGFASGFNAGCPPGPRPWMSTLGTSGL